MFAINHAATALVLKKRYPNVSLAWLLVSVQLVEMLWVVLNFAGLERTSTDAEIETVASIHLAYMPWSHSVASSLVIAGLAWLIIRKAAHRAAATAVAIGIVSHVVLDVLTHTRDIALVPLALDTRIGVGLYAVPLAAFFVETGYGVLCWRIFRGNLPLLAVILACNLANVSFFVAAIRGPEALMAGRPLWIVGAVAAQIVVTLALIGAFAKTSPPSGPAPSH